MHCSPRDHKESDTTVRRNHRKEVRSISPQFQEKLSSGGSDHLTQPLRLKALLKHPAMVAWPIFCLAEGKTICKKEASVRVPRCLRTIGAHLSVSLLQLHTDPELLNWLLDALSLCRKGRNLWGSANPTTQHKTLIGDLTAIPNLTYYF